MAILRIRDRTTGKMQEVLCLKGEKGDKYTLTEEDKAEIAAPAKASQQAAEEAKNEAVEAAREAVTRALNASAAATSAGLARDAAEAAQASAEAALAAIHADQIMRFKGSIDKGPELNYKNNTVGDVWYVNQNNSFYVYNGDHWVSFCNAENYVQDNNEQNAKITALNTVLQDILQAIQGGGATSNVVSEIEQILVSYFETKPVEEIES